MKVREALIAIAVIVIAYVICYFFVDWYETRKVEKEAKQAEADAKAGG